MATFCNQATLSYSGGITNSNITCGEITETVTLTKTAISSSYEPGEEIAYLISIVNTGNTALQGLTLTDNLGAYLDDTVTQYPLQYVEDSMKYYLDGLLQSAPTVQTENNALEITGITVPAGSNAALVYEATTTEYAPLGTDATITNTVSMTGGGLAAAMTAEATIAMAGSTVLTISKSVSPTTIPEDGQLTYTFVIQNTGTVAANAEDAIVVSDTFDPILYSIVVTSDGETLPQDGNYTYNTATGAFATVAGVLTVPAATFAQNESGAWVTTPGVTVLTVSGSLTDTTT